MRDHAEENCLAALLSAIVFLMLSEAVRRHCFPASEPWTLKAAAACLAWLVSLGMARAATLGLHIRVAFIAAMAKPPMRRRIAQFADIIFLFFCLASLVVGLVVLYRSFFRPGAATNWLVYSAIPAGSALTAWRLVARLLIGETEEKA